MNSVTHDPTPEEPQHPGQTEHPGQPERGRRLTVGTDAEREAAVEAATLAVRQGDLVILPTDTVYGIAADAFDAAAVARLLDAKGRGREMPPPVLVSAATTLDALATRVPDWARLLVEAFWPGPLTLVCHQQPSLRWDLGESRGTVAVRMPDHPVALALLERTGPLAVSSANRTGFPAAQDAQRAWDMLGQKVSVIVDAGPLAPLGVTIEPSTIIDCTGETGQLLRPGALPLVTINALLEPHGHRVLGVS